MPGSFSTAFSSAFDVDNAVITQPIVELIRENLVSAIQQITKAGGYFNDPVVEELATANGDTDSLIIVVAGNAKPVNPPINYAYSKQIFYAVGYVMPPDDLTGASAAVDPRLIYLYTDVFNAVYQDRTRGGLAYDTVVQTPQFEANAAEAQFRVLVPIQVLYRTLENDPTSQG